jgi:hypothetical protein
MTVHTEHQELDDADQKQAVNPESAADESGKNSGDVAGDSTKLVTMNRTRNGRYTGSLLG